MCKTVSRGRKAGQQAEFPANRHMVTISLDVSDQSEVKVGDAVSVTLPDGPSTPGRCLRSAPVATPSSPSNSTIPSQERDAR